MPETSETSTERQTCGFCFLTVVAYWGAAFFAATLYHPVLYGWQIVLLALILLAFAVAVVGGSYYGRHFHLFSGAGGLATTALAATGSLGYFLRNGDSLVGFSFLLLFLAGTAIIFALITFFGSAEPQSAEHHAYLATRFFLTTTGWILLLDLIVEQSLGDRLLLLGVAIFSAISIPVVLWKVMQANQENPTMVSDRFVIRNTPNGYVIIKPGEPYKAVPQDTVIVIRPDRQLFQTPQGPRMLHWQPDPGNLDTYVESYHPLRGAKARTEFIAGLEDFFKLNPRPTIEFLQDRYADHMGVQILTLDLPPGSEPAKAQPRDTRSKAEQELDRLFAGVKTAAQARKRWEEMKRNPDFAAALRDEQVGPKLNGKYEDLINAIAEGEV